MPGIWTSITATSASLDAGGREDVVAPSDLGDHGDVGLQIEHGGQRAPHQGLVVGDQHPDHGTSARTRNPPPDSVFSAPPSALSRSCRPVSPFPHVAAAGRAVVVDGQPALPEVDGDVGRRSSGGSRW